LLVISALIFAVLASSATGPEDVRLVDIHENPSRYEGRVVETCGDAFNRHALLVRNWVSGRSRGGMRAEGVHGEGLVCVQAKVERVPEEPPPRLPASDSPILPNGWHLKVIRVLPSEAH
jgi:hypothetical protein